MSKLKENQPVDPSTEEKIKLAAHTVFQKKGYAATRTRDIAAEAGINLALLNYYFRSKEKLFGIIMQETMSGFFKNMVGVLNDENTNFEKKIELFVANYINMLTKEPDVLLFILGEARNRPEDLLKNLPVRQILSNSVFIQQFQEKVANGDIKELNPLHFMINLMGLTVMSFVAKPFISAIGGLNDEQFNQLMQERKTLIPVWIKEIMSVN
jgi:AcrR family transcriptional regulator